MRNLTPCLLLAACASSPESQDATPTTPQPRSEVTIFDRLHDGAGPVAGLDGFSIVHVPDPTRCGGISTTLVRASDAQVAPGDQALVAFLEMQFVAGLDFDEPTRAQSKSRFDAWLTDMTQHADAALRVYSDESSGSDNTKIVRLARKAQIQRHFASTLARAEIPADVRAGDDKTAAYCDALAMAALPLVDKADEAATRCAEVATKPGWWSSVCVH